ncbi:hypothetical protein FOYG_05987 [Fusarium oxysporum NRRL 32931]|uniref:Jacalin-type lectin domain-containing protein n=1 Tax=Fusarium oxysporum NRRL 32931 TaxID=660029 RepID=W9IIX2_FUSOX|nr:hypothetical protein FOYG_05987 [Fusarium oxysporum NRRL 32931]EWY92432.1 hypothetical protein FOYG_05987 [Fusarium oxysporum NRRL 32931]
MEAGSSTKAHSKVPLMTTFFGENDGRYITQMSAIGTGIFNWCHIISLRFEFMDESIERGLGDVNYEIMDSDRVPLRFADHGNTNGVFQIDGANGEEIARFEVQMDDKVVGLKLNLNTNRTEFLSNEDAVFDLPAFKITPSGKKVIGMFSQGIGWGSKYFHNLGFISTNEEQEQNR